MLALSFRALALFTFSSHVYRNASDGIHSWQHSQWILISHTVTATRTLSLSSSSSWEGLFYLIEENTLHTTRDGVGFVILSNFCPRVLGHSKVLSPCCFGRCFKGPLCQATMRLFWHHTTTLLGKSFYRLISLLLILIFTRECCIAAYNLVRISPNEENSKRVQDWVFRKTL